ncbi:MAG: copper transporter [Actinomycetota bacterium]
MISFRYHLVSIIGIFLALALGIVVGTTALNGPITTDLRHQVDALKKDRSSLSSQVNNLRDQVANGQKFAVTFGPQIVDGQLVGQNALIIGMPGADSAIKDGVTKQVIAAGGKVTGRLQITSDYTDPKRAGDIIALTTSVHPIGLVLPPTDDSGAQGGALLAYVLLGKGASKQTDLQQVLAGFAELHMLKVEGGDNVTPATMVVVVASGTLPVGNAGGKTQLSLVTELQRAGGHVVVVGNPLSATAGGAVALVRGDDVAKTTVSTVDNADSAVGQVATVLALVSVAKFKPGHYGTGSGASDLFPEPVK